MQTNVNFENIYLNDTKLEAQTDYNKFSSESMLADTREITEITISASTPRNIIYSAGTITTVIIDNTLTEMDGVLINKIINFSYDTRRDLHVYLSSSVTRLTGGMETYWGDMALITFHFDMTKDEFVANVLNGGSDTYINMFDGYSIIFNSCDYNKYDTVEEQLIDNDYDGIYRYDEWQEKTVGYKFAYNENA